MNDANSSCGTRERNAEEATFATLPCAGDTVTSRYETQSDTFSCVNTCIQCAETLGTDPDTTALDESVKVQVWDKVMDCSALHTW